MPAIMSIAENLIRLRKAANLTQGELAAKAKISQQLVSQIENGKNTTTKYLPKLAQALGCKVSDLDETYDEIGFDLTADEAALMLKLRRVPPEKMGALEAVLDAIVSDDPSPQKAGPSVPASSA